MAALRGDNGFGSRATCRHQPVCTPTGGAAGVAKSTTARSDTARSVQGRGQTLGCQAKGGRSWVDTQGPTADGHEHPLAPSFPWHLASLSQTKRSGPAAFKSRLTTTRYIKPGRRTQGLRTAKLEPTLKSKSAHPRHRDKPAGNTPGPVLPGEDLSVCR